MGSDHRSSVEAVSHRNVVAVPGEWQHLAQKLADQPAPRIGIAVARFNHAVTSRLFSGTVDALLDRGMGSESIVAVSVPGAVELPLALERLFQDGGVAAAVALGCVIRGETGHYDHVCSIASDGCLSVMLKHASPVGFGVLTVENADQAMARSGSVADGERNAGYDAAAAALELLGII